MSTVAIVLAADSGSGFDEPKYLAPLDGRPLLQHVVDDAAQWPVDEVVVVLGSDADRIIGRVDFGPMTVVIDPEWSEGSASPLRAALDLASRDRSVSRCIIARGDQPGIDAGTIGALIDAADQGDSDAVVPKYRYARGWPVVLDYSLWEQLLGGEGTVDLLDVVASHATGVEEVWYDHLGPKAYESPDDFPKTRR